MKTGLQKCLPLMNWILLSEGSVLCACFMSYSCINWAQVHKLQLATEKLYLHAVIKNSFISINNEEDPLIWRICLGYYYIYKKCM